MFKLRFLILTLLLMLVLSCTKEEISKFSGLGKKPRYISESELSAIENLPTQTIEQSGTIFLRDSLFFILEYKKGIHVFNIADTSHTSSLTFFSIPAVTDFTISGNFLYADSWRDLVTIDITNLHQIREVSRVKNAFQPVLYPLLYSGIFECVDETKGILIGWDDAQLENVGCVTGN